MNTNRWRSLVAPVLLALFNSAFAGRSQGQSEAGAKPGALQTAQPPAVEVAETRAQENKDRAAVAPALQDTATIDLGGGVKMEFVLICPGSFTMGSDFGHSDEKPVHKVTLTQPFYLGKYEVTQEQWEKVMGANPSAFKGANLPVENVSWDDCQPFLAALQKKAGRKFALPTEAQWEYACHAGTTTLFSCGDDEASLAEHAWFANNSDLRTHPVGQKKPNAWGLYDMHGNVFEWCADRYSELYPSGDATDPLGAASGDRRVIRGGAWLYIPDNLRSADRGFSPPDYRVNEYGLRCVMLAETTSTGAEARQAAEAQVAAALETQAKENMAKAALLVARLDAVVAEGNRFPAEGILAQLGNLIPGDPRLAAMGNKVAALAWPKGNLVVDLGDGVTMEFVLIRPGSFTMGSDKSQFPDERPAHQVTIARPFYLGKYEVTQKQWEAFMSQNLSTFKEGPQRPDGSKHPVENVSWLLCQSFLAKLKEKLKGYEFRLPTEAEWEYACRAGTTSDYNFGDGGDALGDYAWYGSNSGGQTHPVGGKKPNAWGLYDMYGNVWEWCQDWYGPYSGQAVSDPMGPSKPSSGVGRVVRGGAWNNTPDHVISSYREEVGPDEMMSYYGFRCVAAFELAQ